MLRGLFQRARRGIRFCPLPSNVSRPTFTSTPTLGCPAADRQWLSSTPHASCSTSPSLEKLCCIDPPPRCAPRVYVSPRSLAPTSRRYVCSFLWQKMMATTDARNETSLDTRAKSSTRRGRVAQRFKALLTCGGRLLLSSTCGCRVVPWPCADDCLSVFSFIFSFPLAQYCAAPPCQPHRNIGPGDDRRSSLNLSHGHAQQCLQLLHPPSVRRQLRHMAVPGQKRGPSDSGPRCPTHPSPARGPGMVSKGWWGARQTYRTQLAQPACRQRSLAPPVTQEEMASAAVSCLSPMCAPPNGQRHDGPAHLGLAGGDNPCAPSSGSCSAQSRTPVPRRIIALCPASPEPGRPWTDLGKAFSPTRRELASRQTCSAIGCCSGAFIHLV